MYVVPSYKFSGVSMARDFEGKILTQYYRQLGREGEAEKDYWHWTYETHEGRSQKVQEWLPDRCSQGCERTIDQGRIREAFEELIWDCGLIAL
jgi:hypothetical protein